MKKIIFFLFLVPAMFFVFQSCSSIPLSRSGVVVSAPPNTYLVVYTTGYYGDRGGIIALPSEPLTIRADYTLTYNSPITISVYGYDIRSNVYLGRRTKSFDFWSSYTRLYRWDVTRRELR